MTETETSRGAGEIDGLASDLGPEAQAGEESEDEEGERIYNPQPRLMDGKLIPIGFTSSMACVSNTSARFVVTTLFTWVDVHSTAFESLHIHGLEVPGQSQPTSSVRSQASARAIALWEQLEEGLKKDRDSRGQCWFRWRMRRVM